MKDDHARDLNNWDMECCKIIQYHHCKRIAVLLPQPDAISGAAIRLYEGVSWPEYEEADKLYA